MDHIDALTQSLVAHVFGRPAIAGDVFVDRLAAPHRRPETSGEHLLQSGECLSDHDRVISLPRCIDHADREAGAGERSGDPAQRETRMALGRSPWCEVIGAHRSVESCALGADHGIQEHARCDLLVRRMKTDDHHAPSLPSNGRVRERWTPDNGSGKMRRSPGFDPHAA
jgi:hypothetical protein